MHLYSKHRAELFSAIFCLLVDQSNLLAVGAVHIQFCIQSCNWKRGSSKTFLNCKNEIRFSLQGS